MSLIQSTAKALMAEADFDLQEAKKLARVKMKTDTQFAEMLTPLLCEYAIDRVLEDVWRAGRAAHWQRTLTSDEPQPRASALIRSNNSLPLHKGETSTPSAALMGGVRQKLNEHLTGVLTFEMPGGTLLGDWQASRLQQLGIRVIKAGRSATATGAFFVAAAQLCPRSTDLIRDVLTNADLERLMRNQGYTRAMLTTGKLLEEAAL